MGSRLARLAITVGILIVVSVPANAFPLPPPLVTEHLLGPGLPAGPSPAPFRDVIYPLGWSEAGEWAYLEFNADPPGAVELVVWDLVDDRAVLRQVWHEPGDVTPDQWWQNHEDETGPLLLKAGIRAEAQQLGEFPSIGGETFYQVSLLSHRSAVNPTWIDQWRLVIHASDRGDKTVFNERGYWRWGTVLGFLPSPTENRVAILLLLQPTGWRGPLEAPRLRVVGASLVVGFSKP